MVNCSYASVVMRTFDQQMSLTHPLTQLRWEFVALGLLMGWIIWPHADQIETTPCYDTQTDKYSPVNYTTVSTTLTTSMCDEKKSYQQQVHSPFCLLLVWRCIYSWCPGFLALPLKHKFIKSLKSILQSSSFCSISMLSELTSGLLNSLHDQFERQSWNLYISLEVIINKNIYQSALSC